ncbi:MAG: hypothetical protein EBU80_13700, partial [Chitinophagia bacterium]|nr:hypothetical protein [Chitinophagia bacterium]
INIDTPQSLLHLHNSAASGEVKISLTDGNSGTTTTDGFAIIKDTNENCSIWNYENTSLSFATNNLERLTIASTGSISTNNNNINAGTGTISATTFSGSLSGNASTASGLTGTPNITVGTVSGTTITGSTSVSTPTLTNAGNLNITATGANNLIFNTNGNERIRIDANGNLGIGTNNPQYKLDVNGITNTTQLFSCNISTSNLSVFGDTTILNTTVYQTEQLQVVNDTTATSMIIRQVNVNQNVAEFYNNSNNLSLIIKNNGNIGIGTTNPTEKFDLRNGNAVIEGNFYPLTDVTYDLGTSSKRWKDLYLSGNIGIGTTNPTEKLDLRGGNAVIQGNFYPLTDVTYDLGTSSKRWKDLYLS